MSEDYSQPDFYRFNEDSIKLVKWIQTTGLKPRRILDLGAGSGIIGIELARVLNPQELTLVELQGEFLPNLASNCQNFLPNSISHSIVISSFLDFTDPEKFDLIVCNPPYYLPGKGELSKNPNRAMARSFVVDSWVILLRKVGELMTPGGKTFFVLKNDQTLFESIRLEAQPLDLSVKKYDIDSIMILELFRLDKN
jgi:tRNA1Val (adenine37-N6)-methyltransferase